MHTRLSAAGLPFALMVSIAMVASGARAGWAADAWSLPIASVAGDGATWRFQCPAIDGGTIQNASTGSRDQGLAAVIVAALPALSVVPIRAAFAICTIARTGLAESGLADGAVGPMSRKDALWLQAGYGAGRASTATEPSFDDPKWNASDPTLFRLLPGQSLPTDSAPSLFTFQIGH